MTAGSRLTHSRRLLVLAVSLLPAVCALPPPRASAQDVELVYEARSRHQLITVLDTSNGHRQLIFDRRGDGSDAIQSEIDLAAPDRLILSYARHIMTALPLVGKPRRILVVGLGGACIQRFLHTLLPEVTIETAELDPEVRDVATKYFFLREDGRQIVRLDDGRAFIERSKSTYDLIFLDAFSATSIPYHLTTREFLEAVARRLAVGGVVSANLWDGSSDYWDIVKTYAAVFPGIHVVKSAASGNSILVAAHKKTGLTVQAWVDRAAAFERAHPTGLDLPELILRGASTAVDIPETARVLVDKS